MSTFNGSLSLSPDLLSSGALTNSSISGDLVEGSVIFGPPRVHYAPLSPGKQESVGGDLSILAFDAVDDYLTLGMTDITFTLANSGLAAADSFKVDIIYSDDALIGNEDDIVVQSLTIDRIGAQDTLTRTVGVQLPLSLLNQRAIAAIPAGQGPDYVSDSLDFLAIEIDTQDRVFETDESNNLSGVKGVGLDDVSYFPWDIDGNGLVEVTDEIFVADRLGETTDNTNAPADFDGDGVITAIDESAVQDRIGYRPNPPVIKPTLQITVDVPERTMTAPIIAGVISEAATIGSLTAGFNDTSVESYTDITDLLQSGTQTDSQTGAPTGTQRDGRFVLESAQLMDIYGGLLPDGQHVLTLQTTDISGTPTASFQQTFTIDTQRPTYVPLVVNAPVAPFSRFTVVFNEAIGDSALQQTNYQLLTQAGEAVEILSVDRLSDSRVGLNLAAELPAAQYEFSVTANVSDLAGNIVAETAPFIFQVQDDHEVCLPDESVLTQGGSYSADLGLTASLALPGNQGVDVVMTAGGAIAAVNTDTGSALYWIDPVTGAISQSVELASTIFDIAFDGAQTLAIAASNQLLRISATSGEILSEIELPNLDRVAISKNGYVGAIAGTTVHLYDPNNAPVFTKPLNYTDVTDLEIRSCGDGNDLVYVTSFRNTSFIDIQGNRNPVQIARLEAFDFTGDRQWSLFGDAAETIKQNVADTRLYRVTLGQDGYLYIGGESAGTATIFRWRGQPMTEDEQFGRATPFLSRIDVNSQLHNSGSAHIAYYARVDPISGQLLNSQLSFPRLSSGKSNTMRIGDIAGGTNGSLYFGGAANASIRNRSSLTINGQPIGSYSGQDTVWMAIAPNFGNRNFWTVLSEEGGRGSVNGVDAGYGYSAALSNLISGTFPVTSGDGIGSVFISFIPE